MASFFQPTESCPDVTSNSNFLIYYNSVLNRKELTQNWYQYLVVALGGAAWVLGWLILGTQFLRKRWRPNGNRLWKTPWKIQSRSSDNQSTVSGKGDVQPDKKTMIGSTVSSSEASSTKVTAVALGSVKSFGFFETNDPRLFTDPICDLNIVRLEQERQTKENLNQTVESSFSSASEKSVVSTRLDKHVFGLLDFKDLESGVLGQLTAPIETRHCTSYDVPKVLGAW